MPYVTIPKDLAAVKTKVVFNLTKRQLIGFGGAALLGLPVFFLTKGPLGSSVAILLMMAVMLPLFFLAMFERDGLPAEKIAGNILRTKFLWPAVRTYETNNFYTALQKRADAGASTVAPGKGDAIVRDIREEKAEKPQKDSTKRRPVKTGGPGRKRW